MALDRPLPGEFRTGSTLRTVGFLAVMGLLAIILVGPVIGVLSALVAVFCVVLSLILSVFSFVFAFALIGFCIWLPIRLLSAGKTAAWKDIGVKAKHLCLALWRLLCWYWVETWRLACWLRAKGKMYWQPTWSGICRGAWVASSVLVEAVSGALVGGMLAWVASNQSVTPALGLGAGLGALLGIFVALLRLEPRSA
jgi:hypothetical protein